MIPIILVCVVVVVIVVDAITRSFNNDDDTPERCKSCGNTDSFICSKCKINKGYK
jgi:hypothetical protein